MTSTIISRQFEEFGAYQENVWASHLRRRGPVQVVSEVGIHRLQPLHPEANVEGPGPTLVIGDKGFALKHIPSRAGPLIVFFQEHSSRPFHWTRRLPNSVLGTYYRLRHGTPIRQIAERADCLVINTPDTVDTLRKAGVASDRLISAGVELPLVVDTAVFHQHSSPRTAADLGVDIPNGARIVVSAGKYSPRKSSLHRQLVGYAEAMLANEPDTWFILIGYPKSSSPPTRLVEIDHLDPELLNSFYNLADLVLFMTPSIGMMQALCAGASVLLPDDPCIAHLLPHPGVASYPYGVGAVHPYAPNDKHDRGQIAKQAAETFSVDSVCNKLMSRLEDAP